MPTAQRKTKSPRRSRQRVPIQNSGSDLAAPISKSEPAYININENQADLASRSRTMWTIVAIFSIVLALCWLFILRDKISKETSEAGFMQIGRQISESLARFDTEIKNRSVPTEISADDLAAIKNGLEENIKNNPDSSLWPTHELSGAGISLQYPENWSVVPAEASMVISDIDLSSSTGESNAGRIAFKVRSNSKKLDLAKWLESYGSELAGYDSKRQLFFSSNTPESLVYTASDLPPGRLEKIAFINNPQAKKVYEIRISASGDIGFYQPLTDAIIRTIRIIN